MPARGATSATARPWSDDRTGPITRRVLLLAKLEGDRADRAQLSPATGGEQSAERSAPRSWTTMLSEAPRKLLHKHTNSLSSRPAQPVIIRHPLRPRCRRYVLRPESSDQTRLGLTTSPCHHFTVHCAADALSFPPSLSPPLAPSALGATATRTSISSLDNPHFHSPSTPRSLPNQWK